MKDFFQTDPLSTNRGKVADGKSLELKQCFVLFRKTQNGYEGFERDP